MNKKINVIFLILIGTILNIFFFMFSDNYRYFLQSLKYESDYNKIDDKFSIDVGDLSSSVSDENLENDNIFSGLSSDFGEKKPIIKKVKKSLIEPVNTKKIDNQKIDNQELKQENKFEYINSREKIKLTNIENDILSGLKKYDLKKVDLNTRLFDLTGEYPDEYFEYYSGDINLYFFGNKLYSDLKDIFEVLTYELPFTINQVDNFGNKSFYINLNSGFDDGYIRLVIEKSNRTFGIKIKKELYEKIKNNLGVIFKK